MRRAALALAAFANAISPAAGAEPVLLEPGSKWAADFARDKCRLVRFFGPESARNVMILEQYDPGERFALVVGGPAFGIINARKASTVRFLADGSPTKAEPLVGPMDGYGRSLFYLSVALAESEAKPDPEAAAKAPALLDSALAAQVQFVEVSDGTDAVRLMTGPLESAAKVMNRCTLDLLGTWGLDPEQHRTATRRPRLANQQAVSDKLGQTIPWQKLDNGNGTDALRIRLITSSDGKVESCTLVETPDPKITERLCKSLAKAKVEPGLDAAGQPMRSYITINIFVGAPITVTKVVGT
jgi:hypothetical protein